MKKSFLFIIALTGITLSFFSCKKSENALGNIRQFMPAGNISIVKTSDTSVSLYWKTAVNASDANTSYTVEISQDSLFTAPAAFSYVTDTTGITLSDDELPTLTNFFARVKTNGKTEALDSKWVTSGHFSITGLQIFYTVKTVELLPTSAVLRWRNFPGVTKIVLTDTVNGSEVSKDIALNTTDENAAMKLISGLSPNTKYQAKIFTSAKSVGLVKFMTQAIPNYSFIISPTDNLFTVIDTCSNNAIIGLSPGTYDCSSAVLAFQSKTVTLIATSGTPSDTKIQFKEFKLQGDGAGISLKGIEFDGLAGAASYFINLAGLASDGNPATFTGVHVENCIVHNYGNCFLRGNRASKTGSQIIGTVSVNNSLVFDNLMASGYSEFTLDKMAFDTLKVTNSTFYNVGQTIASMATTLSSGTKVPTVIFDRLTVNNFGWNGKYALFDSKDNPVNFACTGSIFANTPRTGSITTDLFRATGAGSAVQFSYNDYFNLANGSGASLTFPSYGYLSSSGNQQISTGWTATTTDFSLAADSPLLRGSSTGGPIGDPRWVNN